MLVGRNSLVRFCFCRSRLISFFVISVFLFSTFVNVFWKVYPDEEATRLWLRDRPVDLGRLLDETAGLRFDAPDWDRPSCANACDVGTATLVAERPTVYARTRLDCVAMLYGDENEVERARDYMRAGGGRGADEVIGPAEMINRTRNCAEFRRSRGYFSRPLSREEAEFPIAFSILAYKDPQQVERLLRAIYAPQNVYCIHVDAKASPETVAALRALVGCFENAFVASRLENVRWGHISIVLAEMHCLEDLMKYKWKYFINLSGQMFPTHSNRELVKILQLYDGANDIEGSYRRSTPVWLRVRNLFSWRHSSQLGMMLMTFYPKGQTPYNVTIFKGSNQVVLTRAFVVFFLYSKISHDLIEWFADTMAPDEYIWPTLNHNPVFHAPGSYKGDPESKLFTARGTIWTSLSKQVDWSWSHWPCQGKWVREICIFGVGDLPWLGHRPELFVNKFHSGYEGVGYDCMEELIFNRTVYPDRYRLDLSYYEQLAFVANKSTLVTSLNETLTFVRTNS